MKHFFRKLLPIIFLGVCAGIIYFLHLFVIERESMAYIDWQSSVRILEDGTEEPFSLDIYSNDTDLTGTYVFTGTLPEEISSGYLLFETTGLSMSLSLNGTEFYQSSASDIDSSGLYAQAMIPLPDGAGGELVLTCRILDGASPFFPPLIRVMPAMLQDTQISASANRTALPAGAAALSLALAAGIFLLSISLGKADFSLIPLMIGAAALTVFHLSQAQGAYFLSEPAAMILGDSRMGILIVFALVIYLIMNRKRGFWKQLGIVTAWSAAALAVAYVVSLCRGGPLAIYINNTFTALFNAGYYDGLLYWLTWWLSLTCILISAWNVTISFLDQNTKAHGMEMRNRLLINSYHALEEKITQEDVYHHEARHHLAALTAMLQKKDYDGMEALLKQLQGNNHQPFQTCFTENFTINAILQDAALRAEKANTLFQANVSVPKDLAIPEEDLCCLLMNMLDNALEACTKVTPPGKRQLHIRLSVKHNFFTVWCENTYAGTLIDTKDGGLQTTKSDVSCHGFGIPIMKSIAEKYHSLLDISYTQDGIFLVQTALRIPE